VCHNTSGPGKEATGLTGRKKNRTKRVYSSISTDRHGDQFLKIVDADDCRGMDMYLRIVLKWLFGFIFNKKF
jgi:hypothetical protein